MSRGRSKRKKPTRSKPSSHPSGTIEINPRGFAFVTTPEGEFFIPASKVGGAFDKDIVEVSPLKGASKKTRSNGSRKSGESAGQKREARVVRVIERATNIILGRYEIAEPFGVVLPEDPRIKYDIFTKLSESQDVDPGSLVNVEILEYPTRRSAAFGRIVEVLGPADDISSKTERIIARYKLEKEFSQACLAEAEEKALDVAAALEEGYEDIRDRFVFTIDPKDARDFDDAISLDLIDDEQSKRWRLGVHIADVSAYIPWNSSLDLDARRRATSVYLVDRVLPMLPESLSNGLCSLAPHEDRLCVTVDIFMDDNAEVLDCEMKTCVMNSDLRLTYEQAQDIIDGKRPEGCELPEGIEERLLKAHELASRRMKVRMASGGLEFETKEAKVRLDDEGYPVGIDIRQKTDATSLIEEAMVLANELVATYLEESDTPCAYRVHESPSKDSLQGVADVLQEFKWFTKAMRDGLLMGERHAIQSILDASSGRVEAEMVTMLLLRAQMRAVYSPRNLGHYGLGLNTYCHFTSPIRRYPDLMVHRFLKEKIKGAKTSSALMQKELLGICEHSSKMERTAEKASLDDQKSMIVVYMSDFVGESFDAVISGVMNYGIYIRLENCAEGLIPIRDLGHEYFIFDSVRKELRGSDTGKAFRLGSKIRVVLMQADANADLLTFALAPKK